MSDITWSTVTVTLGQLQPWEQNPKTSTAKNAKQLVSSAEELGQFQTVAIGPFDASGMAPVYDGHQRLSAWLRQYGAGYEVKAEQASRPLTDQERRKIAIYSRQIGAWDWDILSGWEPEELTTWGFDVDLLADWRRDVAALGNFLESEAAPLGDGDAEPQTNRAEELRREWGVEPGQMWRLPSRTPGQEHRLICGDCTDAAVVERVMGGEKAEMVWTDPPYGVAVGDKNKFLNSIAPSNRVEENLENDTLDEGGLMAMLCAAFDNGMKFSTSGAAWYVAAPAGPLHVLFGQALKDRGIWRQTIQWVKNNATFSPIGVCYHWQAEPIFFGWQPGAAHRYYGGRKQTTVWEIDRPLRSPEHPTMKPVELVERAIENSSIAGEIVLELFSGSGTTIIAAENLARQCRAVEISPAYVAVALQRYLDAFGIRAELISKD